MRNHVAAVVVVLVVGLSLGASAIEPGQFDDFEDGTTMGWKTGPGIGTPNPHPVLHMPDDGPEGVGDAYIERFSSGQPGAGGKMIAWNELQWSGDYLAAGVVEIRAMMINLGQQTLHMRAIVLGGECNCMRFGSTEAVVLEPATGWQAVAFGLAPGDLTHISGFGDYQQALSDVQSIRLASQESGPTLSADTIEAKLGVDNVQAVSTVAVESATWSRIKTLYE